jgi:hypothetical protein
VHVGTPAIEDQENRLPLAFSEKQLLDALNRAPSSLRRLHGAKGIVVGQRVEQKWLLSGARPG